VAYDEHVGQSLTCTGKGQMTPYAVRRLSGEPIIVMTPTDSFVPSKNIIPMFAETAALMKGIQGKVYRIADARAIHLTFSGIVSAMAEAFRTHSDTLADPRVVSIIVGKGQLVEMAAKAFQRKARDAFSIVVFDDMDKALAYCRERIAKGGR
jgi:hypothetical protein